VLSNVAICSYNCMANKAPTLDYFALFRKRCLNFQFLNYTTLFRSTFCASSQSHRKKSTNMCAIWWTSLDVLVVLESYYSDNSKILLEAWIIGYVTFAFAVKWSSWMFYWTHWTNIHLYVALKGRMLKSLGCFIWSQAAIHRMLIQQVIACLFER
jgi:hypothetical protein